MTHSERRTLLEFGMCVDLLVCGISLLLTGPLHHLALWGPDQLLVRHVLRKLLLGLLLGACWHISLVSSGAYRSYRTSGLRKQFTALARGVSLASFFTLVWLVVGDWSAGIAPRSLAVTVVLFWFVAMSGLVGTRVVARGVMWRLRRRGRNLRHVLMVGTNRRAVALAKDLVGNSHFGYRLTGFVDDIWYFDEAPEGYKRLLLGRPENLSELLRDMVIDEVIIALPIASSYQLTKRIISSCHQQGIVVRCDGQLFDVWTGSTPTSTPGKKLITLYDGTPEYWDAGAKRLIDLHLSAAAILLLMPVFAAVALAIKLSSPGPVFFLQERLGMGKRPFKVFKFRTMVTNAEALMDKVEHLNESKGPTFKLKSDPRITPVGTFLRETSLDELPQLFNVLVGDMSLVGPRPLPMRDYRGFSEDWHRRRFSVKPGITCLWQVSGRSSVGFERWMELDMNYIDHWSLSLDFKIMLKTIPAVMRGSGAM